MTNKKRHLKTIHAHRKEVRRICFKLGIPVQGLLHDLSKYSHKEMLIAKYADGKRSPHDAVREELGYSPSWNHHYHRNKHHSEYWVDSYEHNTALKMPFRYVLEMFADNIAAGKTYSTGKGKEWQPRDLFTYYSTQIHKKRIINHETEALFAVLIVRLIECGEKDFYKDFKCCKKALKKKYNIGYYKYVRLDLDDAEDEIIIIEEEDNSVTNKVLK